MEGRIGSCELLQLLLLILMLLLILRYCWFFMLLLLPLLVCAFVNTVVGSYYNFADITVVDIIVVIV